MEITENNVESGWVNFKSFSKLCKLHMDGPVCNKKGTNMGNERDVESVQSQMLLHHIDHNVATA